MGVIVEIIPAFELLSDAAGANKANDRGHPHIAVENTERVGDLLGQHFR